MISIVIIATILSMQYDVSPLISLSVIEVESSFRSEAKGQHGEIGLMQLHPKYFPTVTYKIHQNLELGIAYLAEVKHVCRKIKNEAWFICYNQGPKSARSVKDPAHQSYFKKVSAVLCKRAPISGQSPLRYCRVNQEKMGQE